MKEQRCLIPVKVTYLNDSWLMMPADNKNSVVTIKGSLESFVKVLKGIKAMDNGTSPRSNRQVTYLQMARDIQENLDTEIWVWSPIWMKFSENSYYIFD